MSNYIALYRKYRPKSFSDVVGQEHITQVLKSEIMQNAVSHAYLFCGSRGTGKTTCAKIFAKAVSCETPVNGDPCGQCEKCKAAESSVDIVEMDAASNNGVDDVRELKERIYFLPIEMKKRVYIIDEVHMMTPGAFNALLKTLEEPPEHVMFILATTELNKIPATILSRCKRFDFHRIGSQDITKRLEYVCEKENIGMEKSALQLIANLSTGAMRDALSMLELFVGQQNVTRQDAEASLGVVGNEIVLRLLKQVAKKDSKGALETIATAYNSSKDLSILCTELGNMLRDLLVMKYASASVSTLIDDQTDDVIAALRDIENDFTPERLLYCTDIVESTSAKLVKNGLSKRTVLEIMAMRLCDSRLSVSAESLLERISSLENAPMARVLENPPANSCDNSLSDNTHSATEQSSLPVQQHQNSKTQQSTTPPSDDGYFDGLVPPDTTTENTPEDVAGACGTLKNDQHSAASEMLSFGEVIELAKEEDKILYSMINDAKAYINGDVLTIKLNPMGYFMATSDSGMKEQLVRICSKILGFAVTIKYENIDDGMSSMPKLFPEI